MRLMKTYKRQLTISFCSDIDLLRTMRKEFYDMATSIFRNVFTETLWPDFSE